MPLRTSAASAPFFVLSRSEMRLLPLSRLAPRKKSALQARIDRWNDTFPNTWEVTRTDFEGWKNNFKRVT